MNNKLSKIEIILTVLVFLLGCCGIGFIVYKRVDKGSGQLTTENYTEFMQVGCRGGGAHSSGNTIYYNYNVTVDAKPHYRLEDVTITYSLKIDNTRVSDKTFTVTVEAGKSFSHTQEHKVTASGDSLSGGTLYKPTLELTVKAITGTYRYTM